MSTPTSPLQRSEDLLLFLILRGADWTGAIKMKLLEIDEDLAPNDARLYAGLAKLENLRLVKSKRSPPTFRGNHRMVYSVTPAGRRRAFRLARILRELGHLADEVLPTNHEGEAA